MSKKMLIVLIVCGVLFLGVIGGGFFMMWSRMAAMQSQPSGAAVSGEIQAKEELSPMLGPTFSLNTFIVNLAGLNVNRYLRITMELELDNEELPLELKKRLPQIRDTILRILPEKQVEDLQHNEGKSVLRNEIMAALNSYLTTGKVVNIYFTEFVIQ